MQRLATRSGSAERVGWRMDDLGYFTRRAEEEREAALKTTDGGVRNTHLAFAAAYETKIRELTLSPARSTLRIVANGSAANRAAI